MEFEFETQINGVKLKISLQTAALTEKDAVKSGVVRGYHCAKVAVNETIIKKKGQIFALNLVRHK